MLKRLRKLRQECELTQADVAQYLGCGQATYSSYEIGRVHIPTSQLIKLADFYQVSVDYLLGLTDDTEIYPRIKKDGE